MFFDALPKSFQRKEAVEMGENFGMKARSVDAFLQTCLGKYLEQPKSVFYKKCNHLKQHVSNRAGCFFIVFFIKEFNFIAIILI